MYINRKYTLKTDEQIIEWVDTLHSTCLKNLI